MRSRVRRPGVVAVLAAVLATGCQPAGVVEGIEPRPLSVADLAKTDVDSVADVLRNGGLDDLRQAMELLYRLNPGQASQSGHPSPAFSVERVFRAGRVPAFAALDGERGADALALAFDPGFTGDRVLALGAGLTSMLHAAYDHKSEFFVLDELDPQKLYDSARNLEIAAWRVRESRGAGGGALFETDGTLERDEATIERLFGKVIARQDTMALIVADRQNRTLRFFFRRIAGAMFLPL